LTCDGNLTSYDISHPDTIWRREIEQNRLTRDSCWRRWYEINTKNTAVCNRNRLINACYCLS